MNNKQLMKKINKTIESYFPRKANSKFYKLFNIDKNYPAEVIDKGLLFPFWDFIDRGGKRWRVLLFTMIIESMTSKSPDKYLPFGIIPEIIHNASLMVDDIEDNSDTRRGKPCLHKIYGVDTAINLGNFLYFAPYSILDNNKKMISDNQYLKIRKLIDTEMINIHLGQNFDLVGHRGIIDITNFSEEHYEILVSNKTGCMIRLALLIAGVLSNADEITMGKLYLFGTNIATIFQVTDDLLNLVGDENKYGKEIGGDISEAKITLMIIHCFKYANKSDKNNLLRILSIHTKVQDTILEAINILKKYKSIVYAEKYCQKIIRDSKKILRSIKFKNNQDDLLDLLDQLLVREK